MLEVTGRDSDGELLAAPGRMVGAEGGPPPAIVIAASREKRGPAAGIGDRVLARLTAVDGAGYEARVIKIIDKKPLTVLGVVRDLPGGKPHRAGRPQAEAR